MCDVALHLPNIPVKFNWPFLVVIIWKYASEIQNDRIVKTKRISWGMRIIVKGKKVSEMLSYGGFWEMIIDCFFEEYIYQWIQKVRSNFIKIPYSRWG